MSTVTLATGYSTAAPSEFQAYRTRNGYLGGGTKTGIVCCHPAAGSAVVSSYGTTGGAFSKHQMWLADCGWPVVTPDLAGDTCGNTTDTARIEEARTWLQASPRSAKSGPVILLGWSEGGVDALAYALAHPTNVAAMVLFEPASDLNDIVVNNRGGNAALVNAAYGGAYNDTTDGPTHSPVKFAASLAGIPTLIFYATDDPVVIPSSVATVVAGIGASCTAYTGTGGHTDAFVGSWLAADGSCGVISRWLYNLGL